MQTDKPTLLIVDDDLPTLQLYQRELSADYSVLVSQDRAQAEDLLTTTPDLCAMVLEPMVSNGSGWELLAVLRGASGDGKVPVVLCSFSDERKRGFVEGAHAFLIKPVLPTELREALRRVIAVW